MKPVVVFVPSRRQCRLTIDDLLTHCAADDKPDRFLNIEMEDLQPHLDHVNDKSLAETLQLGVRYYHEALSKQDKMDLSNMSVGSINLLTLHLILRAVLSLYPYPKNHGLQHRRRGSH
jgi:pre-mRNA-splicing helicase BRR2